MARRKVRVIVSRLLRDDALLKELKALLLPLGIELEIDLMVPGEPDDLKNDPPIEDDVLVSRITAAEALLVLITSSTPLSKLVNRQIECAMKESRRIIGVYAPNTKVSGVPDSLAKFGDSLVEWNGSRILDAMDGKLDGKWSTPVGKTIPPRDIPRYDCSDD